MAWTIARWAIAIGAIACGLLFLNYTFFGVWQAAHLGDKPPYAWEYHAYKSLGYSVVFLATAILVVINLRPGWPHLRKKWTALALIVAILGLRCHGLSIS